jgi:RNA polymerase sigma factor (sigma-70 family)
MRTSLDLALIQAASEGDIEAIEQVLLQYHPTITRFARQFCPTPEDVEDAVQETLWVAYQKIGSLRVAAAFFSWMFQIVRNECYRLLKIHRRSSTVHNLLSLGETEENPELYALLKHDVLAALANLPPPHREILLLRDIEGLSTPEVASLLNLSTATVKSRLHYARNALRTALHQWGE